MEKKRTFGVWLVGGLLRLSGRLPLGYHYAWARFLAKILSRYRQDVVDVNLSRSFPEKSYGELRAIRGQFYLHFATTLTEMIWFGACRGEKGRRRLHESHLVEFVNPLELNRLYAGARQLMLLQAHTGNWELVGGIKNYSYSEPLDITPETVVVAYHGIHSKLWSQIMAQNRTAPVSDQNFQGYIHTDKILRYAIANKEQKKCYIFITDQAPYIGNGSMDIEFMHRQTRSMTAAAALACKLDMAVGYLRYRCRPEGGYTMEVVPLSDHAAGEDPREIMKRYYQLLEEDLREQPWNYLWTHKRWK